MEHGWVNFSCENGIGKIEFGHPQSNSLPSTLLQTLAEQIAEADKSPDVKILVLSSSGEKTFCAGASFDELCSIKNAEEGLRFFSGFAKVINACRTAEKLIIGRIQGRAVGGGVGLAAATDYCLATVKADVKLSELAVGIGPFVVGPAVERKIGLAAMSELTINASEWRTAEWAKSKGLYAEIFESLDLLDEATNSLANRLSTSNVDAMKELKRVFWKGTEHWEQLLLDRAKISGKLVLSDFTRNAIAAFKTK
ncbi:MAG: enoyl-CoA hydratase/isomerase family protein [Bacteroidetes bacterium]|nr:enoyl-CoA hydratase/isomerase family protein [Bacteroidota bacterium]MBM3424024.1 enoyl-CoA hydratase/isomerase family protein [Bacteroidota bacterium]